MPSCPQGPSQPVCSQEPRFSASGCLPLQFFRAAACPVTPALGGLVKQWLVLHWFSFSIIVQTQGTTPQLLTRRSQNWRCGRSSSLSTPFSLLFLRLWWSDQNEQGSRMSWLAGAGSGRTSKLTPSFVFISQIFCNFYVSL